MLVMNAPNSHFDCAVFAYQNVRIIQLIDNRNTARVIWSRCILLSFTKLRSANIVVIYHRRDDNCIEKEDWCLG